MHTLLYYYRVRAKIKSWVSVSVNILWGNTSLIRQAWIHLQSIRRPLWLYMCFIHHISCQFQDFVLTFIRQNETRYIIRWYLIVNMILFQCQRSCRYLSNNIIAGSTIKLLRIGTIATIESLDPKMKFPTCPVFQNLVLALSCRFPACRKSHFWSSE